MARTKKHVPEMSKPAKEPPAYALRYPLRMCESADGDIFQSEDGDRLYHHSFVMTKRAPDLSQPVKRPRVDVEKIETVVDSFPTEADADINERGQDKALSIAMRKRVAEMHLEPPRFAALKIHALDVIAGLQAGMYPPYAFDNADGLLRPSGTDALRTTVKRKWLKLRKRYYNNRHSWTWTDHFKMHHTVWLSNSVLRVPVEALNTPVIAHEACPRRVLHRNEGVEAFNKT